jgi:hypothetical protein
MSVIIVAFALLMFIGEELQSAKSELLHQ